MSASITDTEFVALWNRPDLSARAIAEKLDRTVRAVNKRAQTLNLPPKGVRATKAMKIRAQLVQAAMPAADGVPDPRTPWLADPDIRPVFDLYWSGLKAAQKGEDLVRLRPIQLKLHAMVAAKYPWAVDCLRTLAETSKLLLFAQKVEATMPPAHDPAVLRQEAAKQLMLEIASVMSQEEQRALGDMIKVAADRLALKKGQPLMPTTMPEPPERVDPPFPGQGTVQTSVPAVPAGAPQPKAEKNPW